MPGRPAWGTTEAITRASSPSKTTRPLFAVPRGDIPGVANFAKVSDTLYRGAQPTAEGFKELKRMGIRTVVSLRTTSSDRSLLAGTGMKYRRLACEPYDPDEEDLVRFLSLVRNPENQPVFVHCRQGADRTGWAVAGYRVVEQSWKPGDAFGEMKGFGHHEFFTAIRKHLLRIDPGRVRRLVEQEPAVNLDIIP
jgi:protein tyrosine phosphatase (PTP) superfamily phosphohydrolase (DUF442 family)